MSDNFDDGDETWVVFNGNIDKRVCLGTSLFEVETDAIENKASSDKGLKHVHHKTFYESVIDPLQNVL